MSVYFYEPFFSFDDFYRLFDDAWASRDAPAGQKPQRQQGATQAQAQELALARGYQPRMDIHESPESNLVAATIELPGLNKQDVNIDIQSNRLIVSGEQNFSKEVNEKGFIHRERQFGKFSRTLPLPAGIKPEEIKASMEHGVLTVIFPKTVTEQAPKRITIA